LSERDTIRVVIDGFPEEVEAGIDLARLLDLRGEPAKATVVELNGRYVRADQLTETTLSEGDRVEIILPAFGG